MSEEDDSGKVMLSLTKESGLFVPIIKLCDETRAQVLSGNINQSVWTYSEMLRHLGLKIENMENGETEAGALMLENARKTGIYEKIIEIPAQTMRLANERNLKLSNWKLNDLLESLGLEIEDIVGTRYPVKRDAQYYAKLY